MSAGVKVSQALQGIAEKLSASLNEAAGEDVGFNLIVFTDDRANYVSNCKRELVIEELEKFLEEQKKGSINIPYHKTH